MINFNKNLHLTSGPQTLWAFKTRKRLGIIFSIIIISLENILRGKFDWVLLRMSCINTSIIIIHLAFHSLVGGTYMKGRELAAHWLCHSLCGQPLIMDGSIIRSSSSSTSFFLSDPFPHHSRLKERGDQEACSHEEMRWWRWIMKNTWWI